VRAIGRWSLAALMVNSIIGSGIFGLPSVLAGFVGAASPLVMLLGGVCTGVIMACFAEVASQFTSTGGPYLYARVTFGRFVGIQMGWMLWLAQLTAPAANANLFVLYLGEFWPHAKQTIPRFLILSLLVWGLAAVNLRGVRAGARVSNVLTAAKLLPLVVIIGVGTVFLLSRGRALSLPFLAVGAVSWMEVMLRAVFAYGGFETALTPMAEARNPRRDAAFAVFTALLTCTVVYTLVQWVAVGTVPDLAHSERPLADAARALMGRAGAGLITVGALVSFYGYLSAKVLAVPRITFALAERGDFPSFFAAVHPRFRTPYVSILIFALLTWLLALAGSFAWNLTLSSVARLFYYGVTCAALPVLRRKQPGAALFRLPAGPVFAVIGVIICAVLVTRVDRSGFLILLVTITLAALNWLWARNRPGTVPKSL